jgi:hypothetical protein
MAKMKFANNANTTLASSLTAIATSMSVTSASSFPVLVGTDYFYCTLTDVATNLVIEIVKVTVTTGTTWTITRGQDGTTGTAFAAGDTVSLRLVRASLDDFPKLDEANTFTGVLTASGGVVGNLTGNADTVTTNANLTGAITSVGNATSIASQTGTGTKFVVDTSPTITGATLTTAALNGSLGATTPSTVVATTVTASGAITQTGANDLTVGQYLRLADTNGVVFGSGVSTAIIASNASGNIDSYIAGTKITGVTSTGLAVTGRITASTQPAFTAYAGNSVTNVTGDGTSYIVTYDNAQINRGSHFNAGTYTFTAPVTGVYQFQAQAWVSGAVAANASEFMVVTSNRTYDSYWVGSATMGSVQVSCLADMDAGDTAYVQISTTGGAKIVGLYNAGGGMTSRFSGWLVA